MCPCSVTISDELEAWDAQAESIIADNEKRARVRVKTLANIADWGQPFVAGTESAEEDEPTSSSSHTDESLAEEFDRVKQVHSVPMSCLTMRHQCVNSPCQVLISIEKVWCFRRNRVRMIFQSEPYNRPTLRMC